MKNIAVIFGGRSVEHDISILTGLHAAAHIENARVHYVYLTRENRMLTGAVLAEIDFYIMGGKGGAKRCWFADGCLCRGLRRTKIDAILNCCHSGVGENGELAAYCRVAGVPVTSCNYIAAANLQSKIRTREILTAAGFDQPKFAAVSKEDCHPEQSRGISADSPTMQGFLRFGRNDIHIDFPVIVKPDTLGSSIGVSVAHNETELRESLELVFEMDSRAIVEEFFDGVIEVNCAAMRAYGEVKVSACEDINRKREFLDFENKYLDATSGFIKKGKNAGETEDDSSALYTEIAHLTRKAYELFGASGVVRADFLVVSKVGGVSRTILNEINTVPGFLAYHLWARAGMPYGLVIDLAVKQAIADAESSKSTKTVFKSDILIKNRGLVR